MSRKVPAKKTASVPMHSETMTLTDAEGNQYVVPVEAAQPVHEPSSTHGVSGLGGLFHAIGTLAKVGEDTVAEMAGDYSTGAQSSMTGRIGGGGFNVANASRSRSATRKAQ